MGHSAFQHADKHQKGRKTGSYFIGSLGTFSFHLSLGGGQMRRGLGDIKNTFISKMNYYLIRNSSVLLLS